VSSPTGSSSRLVLLLLVRVAPATARSVRSGPQPLRRGGGATVVSDAAQPCWVRCATWHRGRCARAAGAGGDLAGRALGSAGGAVL